MIGSENKHGLVVKIGFLENFNEAGNSLVDARNTLVILGKLFPGFGGIGKETGDRHFFRIIEYFLDSGMGLVVWLIAKKIGFELPLGGLVLASSTVGVGSGEI